MDVKIDILTVNFSNLCYIKIKQGMMSELTADGQNKTCGGG
jgi:hypothetical protein